MNELINFELLGAQMRMSRDDEETIRRDERKKTLDEMKSEIISLINSNFDDLDDYITFDEVIGFITQVWLTMKGDSK